MPKRMPDIATGEARLAQRLREKAKAASAPPIEELSVACVGARFKNPKRKGKPTGNREMEIMFTERGDPVDLLAEPENEADENAIAVYAKTGVQLGYVSAERTLLIRRAWGEARDVRAVFQERTPWGAWIRVAFDRDPTLPPLVAVQPDIAEADVAEQLADDDFYPDYIPPDD